MAKAFEMTRAIQQPGRTAARALAICVWLALLCPLGCAVRTDPGRKAISEANTPIARETFVDVAGVTHQPAQAGGAKANVLFFLLADCPVSNNYSPEINAIARDYRERGVRCYIVQVDADITAAEARKHAEEFHLSIPVVLDPQHRLVRFAKANIAPSAAIVLPGQTVAYCGRIDDRYAELGKRRAAATKHDLRDALEAVLAGKPVAKPRTTPIGCYITPAH